MNSRWIRFSCKAVVIPFSLLLMGLSVHALFANDFSKPSAREELVSGRDVGQTVPEFYVRAVTGPLRNKSICYVCRNGSRPVVMVLLQKLDPNVSELLKEIDDVVDRNRAAGLKSFAVLIGEEPSRNVPRLQTLAFDSKISLPLTVSTTVVAGTACQDVHPEAATTIVLYDKRKVVSSFAFRDGELEEDGIRKVIGGIRELAGDEAETE